MEVLREPGNHLIGVLASASNQKTRRRTIAVASATFGLGPRQSTAITLTLGGKGRALLKRFGRLPVTITVTMPVAGRTTTIVALHATLRSRRTPPQHRTQTH